MHDGLCGGTPRNPPGGQKFHLPIQAFAGKIQIPALPGFNAGICCFIMGALTRSPKLKWPGCVKMLEQKRFGNIAAIPAAVWLNFSKAFMLKRLMQTGHFNFGERV
jgi:hypothetical protein